MHRARAPGTRRSLRNRRWCPRTCPGRVGGSFLPITGSSLHRHWRQPAARNATSRPTARGASRSCPPRRRRPASLLLSQSKKRFADAGVVLSAQRGDLSRDSGTSGRRQKARCECHIIEEGHIAAAESARGERLARMRRAARREARHRGVSRRVRSGAVGGGEAQVNAKRVTSLSRSRLCKIVS